MKTYIGLLRGVNVGGNTLKMERLRELCETWGHRNIRTYVQSGNVVFEAKGTPSKLVQAMESGLIGETRLPVRIMLRSVEEWVAIVAANPFLKQRTIDATRLHVTFFKDAVPTDAAVKLGALATGSDEFRCGKQVIYLHCPGGYGNTKLSNNRIEKLLAIPATTRNWNTVLRLRDMAAG